MKKLIAVLALAALPLAEAADSPRLKVSEDSRHLVSSDGRPFFYLGDTAWELFHRLNREDADLYLADRARKGFTVIQAVVLAELQGLTVPNPYGHLPLRNNDPTQPVEEYFQHVDYIVNKAAELGMFIGMLPTWGDKWNKRWGNGPEIFDAKNAEAYGEFLGKRYRGSPIIWILGGDRSPETDAHLAITRAMAKGLKKGDGGAHLMTFHPMGGNNSATWFHADDWLDFNMFQSGHSAPNAPNYRATAHSYGLSPVKPVLDGEPRYEDHPINWKAENGWFEAFDVRQAAYWSLLSGACGHTYGDHNIWQMWEPGRPPISAARTPWREALKHPGSAQMGFARSLFESRPFHSMVPDQSLLITNPGGAEEIRAARARDFSFAFFYSPYGRPVPVRLDAFPTAKLEVLWFDPRVGRAVSMGQVEKKGDRAFEPFSNGRGEDWLLILQDPDKKFQMPGEKKR